MYTESQTDKHPFTFTRQMSYVSPASSLLACRGFVFEEVGHLNNLKLSKELNLKQNSQKPSQDLCKASLKWKTQSVQ